MKKIPFVCVLLMLLTLGFTSCKHPGSVPTPDLGISPDPAKEPTALEMATQKLSGTWKVTSLTYPDGYEMDIEEEDIILTFSETGDYSATNTSLMLGTSPAFPAGSKWVFSSETLLHRIVINPGTINFNIHLLTETSFHFTYLTSDAKLKDYYVTVEARKQ